MLYEDGPEPLEDPYLLAIFWENFLEYKDKRCRCTEDEDCGCIKTVEEYLLDRAWNI